MYVRVVCPSLISWAPFGWVARPAGTGQVTSPSERYFPHSEMIFFSSLCFFSRSYGDACGVMSGAPTPAAFRSNSFSTRTYKPRGRGGFIWSPTDGQCKTGAAVCLHLLVRAFPLANRRWAGGASGPPTRKAYHRRGCLLLDQAGLAHEVAGSFPDAELLEAFRMSHAAG